ncbi:MAG: ribosome silencing factor, partial [Euryarchaeota archaeon]|nr:ribosome silencing factor [Euryarchaeota archaeon]
MSRKGRSLDIGEGKITTVVVSKPFVRVRDRVRLWAIAGLGNVLLIEQVVASLFGPVVVQRLLVGGRGREHWKLLFDLLEVRDEVVVLDLTEVTPIVDFFVLTTGTSRRQMHAIVEEADRVLKGKGSHRIGREGYDGTNWILQDYGDVVLHVFSAEKRELYDLEHLWADAYRIDWRAELEHSEMCPHDRSQWHCV